MFYDFVMRVEHTLDLELDPGPADRRQTTGTSDQALSILQLKYGNMNGRSALPSCLFIRLIISVT